MLGMDYAGWNALHEGYDAQRTVMYRKILLEDGDLLEFFKTIYFFAEMPGRHRHGARSVPRAHSPNLSSSSSSPPPSIAVGCGRASVSCQDLPGKRTRRSLT